MTGLQYELAMRNIKIKELSKVIEKSNYYTGQKLAYNNFSVEEAKKIMDYLKIENFRYLFSTFIINKNNTTKVVDKQ